MSHARGNFATEVVGIIERISAFGLRLKTVLYGFGHVNMWFASGTRAGIISFIRKGGESDFFCLVDWKGACCLVYQISHVVRKRRNIYMVRGVVVGLHFATYHRYCRSGPADDAADHSQRSPLTTGHAPTANWTYLPDGWTSTPADSRRCADEWGCGGRVVLQFDRISPDTLLYNIIL